LKFVVNSEVFIVLKFNFVLGFMIIERST